MATFEELLAQSYGNLVKAGERLTSGSLPPVPTSQVASVSPALSQATGIVSNAATSMPDYFGQGVGALGTASNAASQAMTTTAGTVGAYDPQSYQAFMNPYQKEVMDNYTKEMQRQFEMQ